MFSHTGRIFDPRMSKESIFVSNFLFFSGPLIAVFFRIHDSYLTNFIIGASFSAAPSALIAAICNYFVSGRSFEAIKPFLLFLMGATVVSIIFLGTTVPRAITEMRHIEDLRHLEPASIDRIEVFAERFEVNEGTIRTRILSVTDRSAIAQFAQSTSDATAGSPLPRSYSFRDLPTWTHKWYLVASGSTRREYRLLFAAEYPDGVIGRFVVDSDIPASDAGVFKSLAMRGWFELHLRDHLR